MSKGHKLDAESEAVDDRSVIQREEDTGAIELARNRVRDGPGPNSTDEDQPKKNLQAV